MMPPSLWRIRSFTVANLVTFVVYGVLSAVMFLLTLALMIGHGWSAFATGLATLPMTILLALGSRQGRVAGAAIRCPTTDHARRRTHGAGHLHGGLAYFPAHPYYWTEVFPGVLVFSLGMTLIVAPITTTALGDVPVASSGWRPASTTRSRGSAV